MQPLIKGIKPFSNYLEHDIFAKERDKNQKTSLLPQGERIIKKQGRILNALQFLHSSGYICTKAEVKRILVDTN